MNEREHLIIWRKYIKKFIINNIPEDKSKDVLEIGYGQSTSITKSIFPNLELLDNWDQKRKDGTSINNYVLDICEEQIELENKFDIIYCIEVLEHTKKPWVAAQNITKMLRKNGLLFISLPCFLFMHPGMPHYGDYWRFLPHHQTHLFPDLKLIKTDVCYIPNEKLRPIGISYIMEKV